MTLVLVLFGVGGLLVGGVLSLRAQGAPVGAQVLVLVLAVLAIVGGALRLGG